MAAQILFLPLFFFCCLSLSGCSPNLVSDHQAPGPTAEMTGAGDTLREGEDPAAALSHTWTLTTIAGEPVTTPNLPTLEFKVLEQQVQGFTGCNRLSGRVTIESDRIRFSPLATTRMACLGQEIERPFLQALEKTNRYRTVANRLILLQDETELMQFTKNY